MRVKKLPLIALALVAAGLSLTACQNDDDASSGTTTDTPSSQGSGGASSDDGAAATPSTAGTGGSDAGGTTAAGACTTSQLAFSSSGGMGEGTLIINLKNTGSAACTLQGFPGADLKGKDGTISAARSKLSAPKVSVAPGNETRFTLHFPPNNSGGSGVTFTNLIVTPPNETTSHTLSVMINIPASDGSTGSAVTVDPVGTGK